MSWELDFMRWANGWWSSSVLDQILPWLTYLGSHFAVIYSLKFLSQRQRPFLFLELASKFSKGPGEILDPSFPSAHAVFAFTMATLLAERFPRYRVIFLFGAAFIGWTRIYLSLHYPTDVIAGGLLGYGMTKLFMKIFSHQGFIGPSQTDE
jgi:undecaprenyl-diphosphatase